MDAQPSSIDQPEDPVARFYEIINQLGLSGRSTYEDKMKIAQAFMIWGNESGRQCIPPAVNIARLDTPSRGPTNPADRSLQQPQMRLTSRPQQTIAPTQAFAGSSEILYRTSPSPSAPAAPSASPPFNISRPGSSNVIDGGLHLGASNTIVTAGGPGGFPDMYNLGPPTFGADNGFNSSLSPIHHYENRRTIENEPLHPGGVSGPEFDILNWVNDLPGATEDENAIGGKAV